MVELQCAVASAKADRFSGRTAEFQRRAGIDQQLAPARDVACHIEGSARRFDRGVIGEATYSL